ncbi:bifunctional UDP-sugar hydrolase/5'-nucleotidase periplasmic precursor [compost metagenome]
MRFDVNATLARGSRVANVEVRNATTGVWSLLDMSKTYRLFVLSFNATGGDGYTTLAAVPAARRLDIGVLDADVFQSYIDKQTKDLTSGLPVLRPIDASLYSTKSYVQP